MLCTYIYFSNIGSFDGEDMSTPPNDPGVDPDEDQDMLNAEDHEASAERPTPVGVSVPPFSRRGRLDSRYRMELGDQITALIIEAGIRPANMRDIQTDGRMLHMWRGMTRDMYNLMCQVIGATIAVTRLRRTVHSYRHSRAMTRDGQFTSNDSHAYHDHLPRAVPNEHEAPLATSSSSHHGDEARPSATSSHQPTATSKSTSHDHEQAPGPSTVEAALLTE